MDASCCIQRNIHVLNSIQINVCPEYWVHIIFCGLFLLTIYFLGLYYLNKVEKGIQINDNLHSIQCSLK